MGGTPAPVTKIMSLDVAEFERSLDVLAPGARLDGAGRVVVADGSGRVVLTFEPLPAQTLGGLLALPRARVSLDYQGLSAAEAARFLARFDRAFQRGGG